MPASRVGHGLERLAGLPLYSETAWAWGLALLAMGSSTHRRRVSTSDSPRPPKELEKKAGVFLRKPNAAPYWWQQSGPTRGAEAGLQVGWGQTEIHCPLVRAWGFGKWALADVDDGRG